MMALRLVPSLGCSSHSTTPTLSRLPLAYMLLIVPILVSMMLRNVRAVCHGEQDYDSTIGCDTQYLDCESCVASALMHNCHGWCSPSGKCGSSENFCLESDQVNAEWCPMDTDNPPFGSQDCITLSYELYYCNQAVTNVGCDENYASNYCKLDEQKTGVPFCNGDSISIWNMHSLGGVHVGWIIKNPNGVRIAFGGYDTSELCYKFHYEPIQDSFACKKDGSFALKYTLALDGGAPSPGPSPSSPMPVASNTSGPSTIRVPVSSPTTDPGTTPVVVASPGPIFVNPTTGPSATRSPVASYTTPTPVSPDASPTMDPSATPVPASTPPASTAVLDARWWLVAWLCVALNLIDFT